MINHTVSNVIINSMKEYAEDEKIKYGVLKFEFEAKFEAGIPVNFKVNRTISENKLLR